MKSWYWCYDGQMIKKFLTKDQAKAPLEDPNALIDVVWENGDFAKFIKVPAPQIEVIEKEPAEDEWLEFEPIPGENCQHGNTWGSGCAECTEGENYGR